MPERPSGFELGPLEAEVMRLVWEMGEVQVEEVHSLLSREREIAYTTVMTVMSRLAAKGMLQRHKQGRAYIYKAAHEREQVAGSSLQALTDRFFGGRVLPAVSFLLGSAEPLSDKEIAELRRLVDELAERQGKGGGES